MVERNDESHADIMKRMNKLSQEIGERHDRQKTDRLKNEKDSRTSTVLIVVSIIIALGLVSLGINHFVTDKESKEGPTKKKNLKVVQDASDNSIRVKETKRSD